MLEMFFDDEKSFSVFEKILKSDDEKVDVVNIGWKLGIEVETLHNIVHSLEYLDIIEIIDATHVRLNIHSRVLYALCIFDEIVGDYALHKAGLHSGEKDMENGDFQELLSNVQVEEITIEDFIDKLQKGEL